MTRLEELKNLKAELREATFQSVVNDIVAQIELINYAEPDKQVIKYNIEQFICRACETEEILNDDIAILNREASNGFVKRKRF